MKSPQQRVSPGKIIVIVCLSLLVPSLITIERWIQASGLVDPMRTVLEFIVFSLVSVGIISLIRGGYLRFAAAALALSVISAAGIWTRFGSRSPTNEVLIGPLLLVAVGLLMLLIPAGRALVHTMGGKKS